MFDSLELTPSFIENLNDSKSINDCSIAKSVLDDAPKPKKARLDQSSIVNNKIRDMLKKHKGIDNLYDWQAECLKIPNIGKSKNLIYSLPTSGGKTLVAEILMLRQLYQMQKSVIFVLPFVSIVQEKIKSLSTFGLDMGFLVEEYAGGKGRYPPKNHRNPSLYVATIEKAHSLINSFIENKMTDKVGLLVVDEIHMIGDGSRRGANLELSIIKFLNVFKKSRIVGMSATLDNLNEIAKFLNAELYTSDFRPVQLREYAKINDEICQINQHLPDHSNLKFLRRLPFKCDKFTQKRDPDNVCGLVLEVIPQKSCVIFCPTKRQCETLTTNLMNLIGPEKLCPPGEIQERRQQLLSQMQLECNAICPILMQSIVRGLAYHHSGLTQEERKIIEEGFIDGSICLICCTSTLAAGVNLPARRVIIRSPYVGRGFINFSQYKQMTGRAGRAGYDSEGESFVILQNSDKERFRKLLMESNSICQSSLEEDNFNTFKHFILSLISLELCDQTQSIYEFVKCSLFNIQYPERLMEVIKTQLQELLDLKYINEIAYDKERKYTALRVTEFGRAIVKGSIDVSRADIIYNSLKQSEVALNISSYLHMLYLVTPHELVESNYAGQQDQNQPDWTVYLREYKALTTEEQLLPQFLGFNEEYLLRRTLGFNCFNQDDYNCRKFYLTMMLYDLWKQRSTFDVSIKYKCSRGQVQSLLQTAVTLSACLSNFVDEFSKELWAYKDLFPKFTQRLSYCANPELIPLMEINGVKKSRAIQLFQQGYDSVKKVSMAHSKDLFKILAPISIKSASQIISSARMIIQEKLAALSIDLDELISPESGSVVVAPASLSSISTNRAREDSHDKENIEQFRLNIKSAACSTPIKKTVHHSKYSDTSSPTIKMQNTLDGISEEDLFD